VSPPCRDCGSLVEANQRYCLACGARLGSRSPQFLALLSRYQDPQAGHAAPVPPVGAPSTNPPEPPANGLALPAPRISALLVLVFLGFGVLLGDVASSPVTATLAASVRPATTIVPAPPSTTATAPASPPSSSSSSEPASSEETPRPSAAGPSKPTTAKGSSGAATTPASSAGGGEGESSSSESAGSGSSVSGSSGSSAGGAASKLPPVKHVFVIMLSDQPFAAVFGPTSTAHYVSRTLEARGELLVRYDAVAHEQLANGIALLSGQGATTETAANCPTYGDLAPSRVGADQQVLGSGCVYPPATRTLPGQLTAKHLSWRGYVQGMDEAPAQSPACGHPSLGATDPTATQTPAESTYATFRNPFVYFHSVIDSPACASHDVGLNKLSADLASAKRTPAFSYIVPDRCNDGSATPCGPGAAAGVATADGFLRKVVPEIMGSKAYKQDGLLVITVDEAPSSGELGDSSSCCGEPRFPNLPAPGTVVRGHGGGAVGALLLSPYVKGATTSQEAFNHFSLLRTIEDLFGLGHLGYAGASGVRSFEPSMFLAHASHGPL